MKYAARNFLERLKLTHPLILIRCFYGDRTRLKKCPLLSRSILMFDIFNWIGHIDHRNINILSSAAIVNICRNNFLNAVHDATEILKD